MLKLSLRGRVAVTFAILGLVVSTCVALLAVHFSDAYVHRLIKEMLRVESQYLRERFADDNLTPHPRTRHFYVYVDGSPGPAPPSQLKTLSLGLHQLSGPRGERHVAVYKVNGHRFYVVLDIGLESVRERRLARDLIALVLLGSGLSAWLGWSWAGRAIEPVRRLSHQVEELQPAPRGVPALAHGYASDEVGALAHAFDRYQQRLYAFVRRERAFTADASHELRTPLAVIRGALEVMLDLSDHDPATAARLKRMQRGSDELSDLLDALLILARGDELDANGDQHTDLSEVVKQLLRDRADAFRDKQLSVDVRTDEPLCVMAPSRVLKVVFGNLLRACTEFAENGTVRVEIANRRLCMDCRLVGTDPSTSTNVVNSTSQKSDRILGLGMIRRVCERQGWTLHEDINRSGMRCFALDFDNPIQSAVIG